MEIIRSIRASILQGMWTTSQDLTDPYFHIPICPSYRKFLRFVWNNKVYHFRVWPLYCTFCFHQGCASCRSSSLLSGHSDSFLSKRFSSQNWKYQIQIIPQELFLHLSWWTVQENTLKGELLSFQFRIRLCSQMPPTSI